MDGKAVCGCGASDTNCNVDASVTGQTCSAGGICEGGNCQAAGVTAASGTTYSSAEIDFLQMQSVTFDCVTEAPSAGVTITVFMTGDLNESYETITVSAGPQGGTLTVLGETHLPVDCSFQCNGILTAGTSSIDVSASDFNSSRTLSTIPFSIGFSLIPSADVDDCLVVLSRQRISCCKW